MAEEKKDKKKKKQHSGGEMAFGLEVLLFVLVVFVLWVLLGGAKKPTPNKPFIVPLTDPSYPGRVYGPEDLKSHYRQNLGTQYGPVDVPTN
jgi:hypothetical protein